MKAHHVLSCLFCLGGLAACTKLPADIPGVEQQLPTTPRTPELEPTISPPQGESADPAAEWMAPDVDDPDSPGTVRTPAALFEQRDR